METLLNKKTVYSIKSYLINGGVIMNSKGQSALEYLMTYGWALIVIAIVIAILIVVTQGSAGGVVCQSGSNQIPVDIATVAKGNGNVGVSLLNATGHDITAVSATGSGDFAATATQNPIATVSAGSKFVLSGMNGPAAAGNITNGTITVTYTVSGLAATAVIKCTGNVK